MVFLFNPANRSKCVLLEFALWQINQEQKTNTDPTIDWAQVLRTKVQELRK